MARVGRFRNKNADAVAFEPFDTIEADNVQDAIEEVFNEAGGGFLVLSVDSEDTTTSNGWTTMDGWPLTSSSLVAGDYEIDYTAQVGQSDKEKIVGSRVQYREGTSGGWTTLPGSDIREAVSVDDGAQLRTSFQDIVVSTDTVLQFRWQFGQTDDGGTGTIAFSSIKISRIIS